MFFEKLKLSKCFDRQFAKIEADCSLLASSVIKYREIVSWIIRIIGDVNVKKINGETIMKLKQFLNRKNLSPNRKNQFLVVLRNLLKYLAEEEKISVMDYTLIKKFRVPAKEVEYLTKEEIIKLANYPKRSTRVGKRMRAAIWILISTACRLSELLRIKISDIDFESGTASIRTKGDRPHTILFNKQALEAINDYLNIRKDNNPYLFVTARPNPAVWKGNDVERSLRMIGRKLRLKKNLRPHLIRKSSATLMYKSGVSLGVIQNYLNHASARTTLLHYLGNSNFDELKRNHEKVMNSFDSVGEKQI
jgi:integrase